LELPDVKVRIKGIKLTKIDEFPEVNSRTIT